MPRFDHGFVDLAGQVALQLLEAGLDLLRIAAVLVNLCNAAFEIDARPDGAQNFVAGMTLVWLVQDLANRALVFRPNKRRALGIATAMVGVSVACSILLFVIAARGGGPEYVEVGIWSALFPGEGVLHYLEHARRCEAAAREHSG